MLIRNPFPILKKYVDIAKYKEKLDPVIKKFFDEFFEQYKILSFEKIINTFWELAEDKRPFGPLDWYDNFAIFIIRFFLPTILLDERRINRETHQIYMEWFTYLVKRIVPNVQNISSDFFIKLYSESLIPIPSLQEAYSLLRENIDLIAQYDFPETLYSENTHLIRKIRIFQDFYMGFFELFLRKCQYIDNQLAFCEERRSYRKFHKIFGLYDRNERTPPELIRDVLKELNHVRNACAHKHFTLLDDKKVNVKDIHPNTGEITFDDTREIFQLWNYFYSIITLDKGICTMSLLIMLKRRVEEFIRKNTKIVQCPDCEFIDFYCIPPNIKIIICNNCKIPIFTKNLA